MLNAYLYSGLRSPIGRHAGVLSSVRPDDLVGDVMKAVLAQSGFMAEQFEDVILGNTNQAGEDSRNVARNALLAAGLPTTIGGQTVNRLCASGLAAIIESARAITCNEGDLYLAGGVESMSRAPFVMLKSTSPFQREFSMSDTTIGARFANPKLTNAFGNDTMPQTGDNVAKDHNITRDQADQFALASQAKFAAAQKDGFMAGEITAIAVAGKSKKDPPIQVMVDEHPRETSMDILGKLKPLFDGGVVTAGNASGINDGACVTVVGSREVGERAGVKPIARIIAAASAGVPPRVMGIGPAYAIPKALARAGLTLKDMDIIEINEAFASQVLGCLRIMGVADTDARVNPNGGAIAVGHPLGASGARVALTAARQLQRTGGRYAAVSLCIGVGQGLAIIIERV
jgi:3-oxoadipyl-CoA thiolase